MKGKTVFLCISGILILAVVAFAVFVMSFTVSSGGTNMHGVQQDNNAVQKTNDEIKWTDGLSFESLRPGEEAVRSENILISTDNSDWQYQFTYTHSGLALGFGLRAEDGTEYSQTAIGGMASGMISGIPAGNYQMFVRNCYEYTDSNYEKNNSEVFLATGCINFKLLSDANNTLTNNLSVVQRSELGLQESRIMFVS